MVHAELEATLRDAEVKSLREQVAHLERRCVAAETRALDESLRADRWRTWLEIAVGPKWVDFARETDPQLKQEATNGRNPSGAPTPVPAARPPA